MKIFSTSNSLIFGYFDPINIDILIKKINNFRGDLSDVSAKTAGQHSASVPVKFSVLTLPDTVVRLPPKMFNYYYEK